MVEQSFPVFMFAPSGVTWPTTKEMLTRLDHLKADTLLITDRSNKEVQKMGRSTITVPLRLGRANAVPEELYTPIPYIIPAQLFAACWRPTRASTRITRGRCRKSPGRSSPRIRRGIQVGAD
jgi:glucosamine--fructose-6-phosphate aminotransferase (isomerizing)